MSDCCGGGCSNNAAKLREKQKSTLIKVLIINSVMFVVIVIAALYGNSSSLLSDSLDNLGDALTYGLSLVVIASSMKAKAKVALFKGALIFAAACMVVMHIAIQYGMQTLPRYDIMQMFSVAGLMANGLCLYLLWQHRHDDINMSSVYECSRNDILSNLSVLIAAFAVMFWNSKWPDMIVAGLLVIVLLRSSGRVMMGALKELKATSLS